MLSSSDLNFSSFFPWTLGRWPSIAVSSVTVVFLALLCFRFWAFTVKPWLRPDEPRELPYWIPYFGHALEFVNNGQSLTTRARIYFKNRREPFALTLGGEKLYFLTSPDDVQTFYKNTTSLKFESVVYDLGIMFGVSKQAMDRAYEKPESEAEDVVSRALGTRNSRLKCLADLNKEFWKMQLHPGEHYLELQDVFLEQIQHRLGFAGIPPTSVRAESAEEKTVSLLELLQRVLVEAALTAFFGAVLLESEPSIVQDFLDFDDENWKLWYKWPNADQMFAAKGRMAKAIERYLGLPNEQRSDASFIIKTFITSQRALDTSDEDLAKILCMLVFVMNTNTYKASFWALAFLLQDKDFVSQIKDETTNAFSDSGTLDSQYLAESCPRLSSLVNEVLRFCSASSSMRVTSTPTIINAKLIPANSRVMVPTHELHFNDAVFGSLTSQFLPDRFLGKDNLEKSPSFRPFGGGITHCPGRFIAAQEVKMVVAILLRNYDLDVIGETSVPELETKKPTTGIMGPKGEGDILLRLLRKGECM
ncbi:cytochrome P450 [Amniculicola lignicola CBS 123094]|uniref:Cytochrome P450 n=1 Tax=Amniculicola lignicola CBS 123094 TaxID=1392246 RepID=A0A6A5W8X5_9PLEO|nr:cytochrome P450 [Amniculicola lignicola CBS 123094]